MSLIDLTGQTFKNWTVLERTITSGQHGAHFECQCTCGAIRRIMGRRLRQGTFPQCECQPRYNFIDLTDHSFGQWLVLERAHNNLNGATQWWCQCICGTRRIVVAGNLASGQSLSCGCYKEEKNTQRLRTHGQAYTSEYRIWAKMKERCYNPHSNRFKSYGGRGITVCEAWRTSFEAFYQDMGPRPSPHHSLERRNNNASYTPENTYWTTPDIQARNTRRNILLTLNGDTFCAEDWAFIKGIHAQTLLWRKHAGWPDEETLNTPIRAIRHGKGTPRRQ